MNPGLIWLPRDLHPVAWWGWAIGLAVVASCTTNIWMLLLVIGVAALVVAARRGDHPWSGSFRIYVALAAVIVVTRVVFRILFGGGNLGLVVLDLPEVPLPGWALGVHLLGPVTRESLLFALYDGLRLGTIVICVGAANSLANPKRLLRSMPAALYEVGTALVVAITILPQLADSLRRVRAAQRLRGGDTRRVGGLRRLVVPVLEDALERSLALAAGMDARGYGRATGLTPGRRRATGGLMLAGLCGLCVGTYAVLDRTAPRVLALPMLAVGAAVALTGLVGAGSRVTRSRYRPDPWRLPEWLVLGSGVVAASIAVVARRDLLAAYPTLDSLADPHPHPPARGRPRPRGRAGRSRPRPRRGAGRPARGGRPMIELRGVSLTYDETRVLDGVDLAIGAGELVLVTGPTGSGKSTLLGVLSGLIPRFSGGRLTGDVLLDGVSIVRTPPRERAHLIGYVGQDPAAGFVTDTVEEELAYGMEQLGLPAETMRRRVEETLDLLGIADLRARDLRRLSGGEQQRVALGSVLTMHPRILVLDEPTSALDPTAAEDVLATLTRLVHDLDVSVVLAEHRLERVVPFADTLVVLDGHGGLRVGSPVDLLTDSPVAPPIVELGRAAGWVPLPLTVRDARRRANGLRDRLGPPPALVDAPRAAETPSGGLGAGGVTVTHGSTLAVHDVSIRLRPGTVTALMGRNGSGKSSLMWALQGSGKRRGGVGEHRRP